MVDNRSYTVSIIYLHVAYVLLNGSYIQKHRGRLSRFDLADSRQRNFGSNKRNSAYSLAQHPGRSFSQNGSVIVGVAQDHVIGLVACPLLEALDHFRKKRVLDVRDDHAQRLACILRQIASV